MTEHLTLADAGIKWTECDKCRMDNQPCRTYYLTVDDFDVGYMWLCDNCAGYEMALGDTEVEKILYVIFPDHKTRGIAEGTYSGSSLLEARKITVKVEKL